MTVTTLYLGLLLATLAQSILLIAVLLTNKHSNKVANYFLSGIIALFSYYTLVKILCSTNLIFNYPHFTQTYRPLPFLIWPAFYFYTKAITNSITRFQVKDSIHLLPFVLYSSFLLPFYFADETTKLQSVSGPIPFHYILAVVLQTALLLFYLILSYRELRDYQHRIEDVFSNLEKIKLNWLKHLLVAFGVIWGAAFIKAFVLVSHKADFVIPPILLCFTIYAIGFYALKQPEIFKGISIEPAYKDIEHIVFPVPVKTPLAERPLKNEQLPRYEYSGLTPKELSVYGEQLVEYLEKEKPYLNNDLKLNDIADHFGLPAHQISQIINTKLNMNFYSLINYYRIEEAKRRLIEPVNQNQTILAIAYDVGFNSKSAFNNAFKKFTDMTPSQYKQLRLSASIAELLLLLPCIF